MRLLGRAARSLDHDPRPRRLSRRAVRRGEAAFRAAEREWLDEQGVVEYEEDFSRDARGNSSCPGSISPLPHCAE
jgi:hypothetical protein